MTDLFSKIDEDTLKQLAKRYHKVLVQRNNNGAEIPSLMEIQENLARAVGHKNMHAAQAYWDTHKNRNRNTQPEKAATPSQEVPPNHSLAENHTELLKSVIKESVEAIVSKWDKRGRYFGFERFAIFDLKTLYHEVHPRMTARLPDVKLDTANLYDLIGSLVIEDETIKKAGWGYTTVASYEASKRKVKVPQNPENEQQQNSENANVQKKLRP